MINQIKLPHPMKRFTSLSEIEDSELIDKFPALLRELESLKLLVAELRLSGQSNKPRNKINKNLSDKIFYNFGISQGHIIELNINFDFDYIPDHLWNLEHLEKLTLQGVCGNSCGNFARLKNLKSLGVFFTNKDRNHRRIVFPENLQNLLMVNVDVRENPPEFKNLNSLSKIIFRKVIGVENILNLGELTNLSHLDIGENNVENIPESVFNSFKNLKVLKADTNSIKHISENIKNLEKLRVLDLDNNLFTHFPREITKLSNLRELYISNNAIQHIPRSIERLKRLEILNLADNKIRSLPDEFVELIGLKRVFLQNNKLVELPELVGKLTNLERAYFNSNTITQIPKSLFKIPNLKILNISSNRLVYSREEVKSFPKHIYITF